MKRKMLRTAVLANGIFVIFLLLYSILNAAQMINFNPFKVLDNFVYDYDMKSTTSEEPHEDIIVVAIDDYTVDALGRFPFSREYYIPFLENVVDAKAVVFDIQFTSTSDDPEIDEMFADQLSQMDNVILAASVDLEGDLERAVVVKNDRLVKGHLVRPLDILANEARIGHINRYASQGYDDGTIRRTWLMLDTEEMGPIPSIAYLAAEMAGAEHLDTYLEKHPQADMMIKYDASSYSFLTVSYLDVLTGDIPQEIFADRVVLIGVTGLATDTGNTAIENNVNLVYAHAAIIDQLLKDEHLSEANGWTIALLMAILFILAIVLPWWLKSIFSIPAGIITVAIFLFGQYYIFRDAGYFINIIYPLAVFLSGFIVNMAIKTYFEQKHKNFITKQFGRYISPDLVKEIARSDEELPLGGINKELSILFLDIRGFTTLSEKLQPQEVVDFLNTMFDLITEKALENKGTIDKFIGDAAMILFNAPLDVENHAYYAVKTAYDIQKGMEDVRQRIFEKYEVTISVGVGVNTGEVVVGNIGSYLRVDYTAIGDNVNVASRIESNTVANQILVSETTYERTKEDFEYQCIGERMMKGKTVPVKLYEVVDLAQ